MPNKKTCDAGCGSECVESAHKTYLNPEGSRMLSLCAYAAKFYKKDGWSEMDEVAYIVAQASKVESDPREIVSLLLHAAANAAANKIDDPDLRDMIDELRAGSFPDCE